MFEETTKYRTQPYPLRKEEGGRPSVPAVVQAQSSTRRWGGDPVDLARHGLTAARAAGGGGRGGGGRPGRPHEARVARRPRGGGCVKRERGILRFVVVAVLLGLATAAETFAAGIPPPIRPAAPGGDGGLAAAGAA